MKLQKLWSIFFVSLILGILPAAQAQDPDTGPQGEALPPPQSDNDPQPVPSGLQANPADDVTEQAGVGGTQAYGRKGVLELGGSAGLNIADDYFSFNISPSAGYFILDNIQLSALLNLGWIDTGATDGTFMGTALVEPSVHYPLSRTLFVFGGVGLGLGVSDDTAGDTDIGFALAPRLGLNIMVGRSGILSPFVQLTYVTSQISTPGSNQVLLGVKTLFTANIGYTVMW